MSYKTFKQTLSAWTLELVGRIGMLLPNRLTDPFIRLIGHAYGSLPLMRSNEMAENLRSLLNYSEAEIKRVLPVIFENFGLTLFHFFSPGKIVVEVPDRKKLEELRKNHKGIMILTFHIGHWELGARTLNEWGWPVTAVYQEYQSRSFQRLIESRRAPGVHYIPVGAGAARGVRDALKRGDIVAMLGDHAFGEGGIPVKLFGQDILWPKGPALLALRENVPIVVALVTRIQNRTYQAIIEEPIYPHGHTRQEIHRLVQEITDKFSRLVVKNITQWYRFMPFERPKVPVESKQQAAILVAAEHHR